MIIIMQQQEGFQVCCQTSWEKSLGLEISSNEDSEGDSDDALLPDCKIVIFSRAPGGIGEFEKLKKEISSYELCEHDLVAKKVFVGQVSEEDRDLPLGQTLFITLLTIDV